MRNFATTLLITLIVFCILVPAIAQDEKTTTTGSTSTEGTTTTIDDTAESHKKLADDYLANNEPQKAIDEYTKAIELQPDDPTLYFSRAFAHRRNRDVDSAVADYKKAIELNPKYEDAYYELALLFSRTDQFDQSLEYYNKLIEIIPEKPRGYYGRALLYYYNEKFEDSIPDFEKVKMLDPEIKEASGYISLAKGNIPGSKVPATDFKAKTIDGKDISLSEFKGKKAIILDQWATWCPPCRAEMPELQKFFETYSEQVQIIGSSRDKELKPVEDFVKDQKITFQIVHDKDKVIGSMYPCDYIPFLVVINKDGEIVKTFIGFDEGLTEKLETILGLKPAKDTDEDDEDKDDNDDDDEDDDEEDD